MAKLTDEEKAYNAWWFSRFDAKNFKIIRLMVHSKIVQTYTTMNARYSDEEDAECAFYTAEKNYTPVTAVVVGVKRYKKINGKIQRIANMEEKK